MTPRDRRAILLGLVILLGVWLGLRGVPRLAGRWIEARHRLDARHQLLAETRAALAGLPRMEDSARALTAAICGLAPRILTAGNAPLAHGRSWRVNVVRKGDATRGGSVRVGL